jgi:drug/metabolite transporter (DMT)-like permease
VHYQPNNFLGIGLMMLAMLLFVLMDTIAKWLVSVEISPIQVIAVRCWIILPIILVTLAARGEVSQLTTSKPWQHLLRGCLGFCAPLAFFTALKSLPLADATVVFFSSTFVLTAASALFLKERVGIHRWSAVVIGFGGVVIAMNPRGGGDLDAYLLVLVATVIYAMIFITGKTLSRTDSITTLVFSLHFGMGVMATLALPWVWMPMSWFEFAQMGLFALIALAAHFLFTAAFARADVSVLVPFEYTSLLWATLIGYLVWRDIPSTEVWIGAAIIIACGLYVIHRESLHHRSHRSERKVGEP